MKLFVIVILLKKMATVPRYEPINGRVSIALNASHLAVTRNAPVFISKKNTKNIQLWKMGHLIAAKAVKFRKIPMKQMMRARIEPVRLYCTTHRALVATAKISIRFLWVDSPDMTKQMEESIPMMMTREFIG